MTRDDINRYIHQEIMGECWHTDKCWTPSFVEGVPQMVCRTSGVSGKRPQRAIWPNYCSDTSPREFLNKAVAKTVDKFDLHEAFDACLLDEMGGLDFLEPWMAFSVATAEQIARACVDAHSEYLKTTTSEPTTANRK